jgi:hypothetical protein
LAFPFLLSLLLSLGLLPFHQTFFTTILVLFQPTEARRTQPLQIHKF